MKVSEKCHTNQIFGIPSIINPALIIYVIEEILLFLAGINVVAPNMLAINAGNM